MGNLKVVWHGILVLYSLFLQWISHLWELPFDLTNKNVDIVRSYHNLRFIRGQRDKLVMEITQEHRTQIEEIISGMECPKDFKCYESGFENLRRAKIFREAKLVECFEKTSLSCKLSHHFGLGYFCKCSLRRYIAQNFNRWIHTTARLGCGDGEKESALGFQTEDFVAFLVRTSLLS